MGMITIHTTRYNKWEEGEDEPTVKDQQTDEYDTDDYTEDLGDWSDNAEWDDEGNWSGEWIPATSVAAAVEMLIGHGTQFWAQETSAEPTDGVNVWYSRSEHDVYTDALTEQTAHLSGFTEDEQREIYRLWSDR